MNAKTKAQIDEILDNPIARRAIAIAAEEGAKAERERMLDEVRDRCAEKMSERNPSITGVMLYYILSDLRSPSQKQEREP